MKKHPILLGELICLFSIIIGFILFGITAMDLFLFFVFFGVTGVLIYPILYFRIWVARKSRIETINLINKEKNNESQKLEKNDEIICEIIHKCFKVTLIEADRLYKNASKIENLSDCIFLKIFADENLIINVNTKEYLYCKYPIQKEKFIKFYQEGKRCEEANAIIEEKIKLIEETKLNKVKEKSEIDGIDYIYILNYDGKDDYINSKINRDINNEKTLFAYVVEGERNSWGYFDGDLSSEKIILKHKCCTLGVAMLVYKRVKEWLYADDVEIDDPYYKFLLELYNDIKDFKYEIGELLPDIKKENVDGSLRYVYPQKKFDFNIELDNIPNFESEENEFNEFFRYLNSETQKNLKNTNQSILDISNQLKLDKKEIINLI